MAIDKRITQGSLGDMMRQQAAQSGGDGDNDADDNGQITCPNCGCGFTVTKQTTYQPGQITSPPTQQPSSQGAMPSGGAAPQMPPSMGM